MHIDEFRLLQQNGASFNQFQLIMACRRKFLNAANLLELHSPTLEKLNSFGVDAPIDIHPLLDPFFVLAERYIEEYFSPQKSLFPALEQEQDVKWGTIITKYLCLIFLQMTILCEMFYAQCEPFQVKNHRKQL